MEQLRSQAMYAWRQSAQREVWREDLNTLVVSAFCFVVSACIFREMPFCAAPFCSNRTPRDSKRGISFHRLPISNKKIAQKWLVKLGREEKFLPKRAQIFVCLEHFTDDCFEVEHRYSLLGGTTHKRKRKPDAVPTKASFSAPGETQCKRKKTQKLRKKRG